MLKTRPSRWGNSIGIRLPKDMANRTGISTETVVSLDVTAEGNGIIIRRLDITPSLADLVAGITPQNRHGEVAFGHPAGKELL
jgi:antitoxin MazE